MRQGVTFIASTGDAGPPSGYPATSPNVIAVGGTRLTLSGGNYGSESAWSSGAGGTSLYEAQPSYQTNYGAVNGGVLATLSQRATPDVSFVGDPATGVNIYYNGNWVTVGGTSVGAPCWAGMIAVANQIRVANGYGTLDGPTETLPGLYNLPSTNFHDITTGTVSGSGGSYSAGVGYDLATGLGTPIANLLLPALANYGIGVKGNWTGTVGGSWSTTISWDSAGMPGATNQDTATFGPVIGSNAATITLDGSRVLSGLSFSTTGGGSYTLSRANDDSTSTLTLATSTGADVVLTNNGGSHVIDVPVMLGGNMSVSAASGTTLTIKGPVTETGGGRSMSLSGGGTLVLAAANNHSGATTINNGTLNLAHPLAAQNSTVSVSSSGAVAFAAGNTGPTLGGLAGAGNIALATATSEPVTLNVGNNNQSTKYSGSLSGPGGLTKQGTGTLTIETAHSYGGPTVISGGMLKLQAPNAMNVTANLGLWLDATKLSLADGASVSTWNDLSGNNRNATAGTAPTFDATNSAFGSLPTVHFDGSSQYLNVDLTFLANSAYTIFAVTAKNSSNAPAYFLGNSTGRQGPNNTILQCGWAGDTSVRLGQYGNDLNTTGPAYSAAEVASLYQGKFDRYGDAGTAGHYVYYNDRSVASSNSNANTTPLSSSSSGTVGKVQLRTGSGTRYNYFNGDIGEILVFKSALSDSDRQAVDAYLNGKWGLGISGLPSVGASNLLPITTPLTIAANATLDLGGLSQQVASLSDASPGGGGSIINSSSTASVFIVSPVSGSTTFSGVIGGGSGVISLVKTGGGTLVLTGANAYTGLTKVTSGVLELGISARNAVLGTSGGGADIQAGKIVFDYADPTSGAALASAIASLLTTSYGSSDANRFAASNGGKLFSSVAVGNNRALGWSDDGTSNVTVMYTLYGDATLDGQVNFDDLNKVLTSYNQAGTWATGDFNYDGSVNFDDLNKVLTAYNTGLGAGETGGLSLDAQAANMLSTSGNTVVPEPSSVILLIAGLMGLLASRMKSLENGRRIG